MGAHQRGFTYLGALVVIALMSTALVGAGALWSTTSRRDREQELLWVGSQYAQALRRYYQASPDVRRYPLELEELLEDRRGATSMRHLRRLYPDPIARSPEWGLIRGIDGRIVGIHSLSRQEPFKRAGFPPQWGDFEGRGSYAEWTFVADRAFLEMPAGAGAASVPRVAN